MAVKLNLINPVDDDLLCAVANKAIVAPGALANTLAQVVKAAAQQKGVELDATYRDALANVTPNTAAQAIATSLSAGKNATILLGNLAQHSPQAATLHSLGLELARVLGAKFGFLARPQIASVPMSRVRGPKAQVSMRRRCWRNRARPICC